MVRGVSLFGVCVGRVIVPVLSSDNFTHFCVWLYATYTTVLSGLMDACDPLPNPAIVRTTEASAVLISNRPGPDDKYKREPSALNDGKLPVPYAVVNVRLTVSVAVSIMMNELPIPTQTSVPAGFATAH